MIAGHLWLSRNSLADLTYFEANKGVGISPGRPDIAIVSVVIIKICILDSIQESASAVNNAANKRISELHLNVLNALPSGICSGCRQMESKWISFTEQVRAASSILTHRVDDENHSVERIVAVSSWIESLKLTRRVEIILGLGHSVSLS